LSYLNKLLLLLLLLLLLAEILLKYFSKLVVTDGTFILLITNLIN